MPYRIVIDAKDIEKMKNREKNKHKALQDLYPSVRWIKPLSAFLEENKDAIDAHRLFLFSWNIFDVDFKDVFIVNGNWIAATCFVFDYEFDNGGFSILTTPERAVYTGMIDGLALFANAGIANYFLLNKMNLSECSFAQKVLIGSQINIPTHIPCKFIVFEGKASILNEMKIDWEAFKIKYEALEKYYMLDESGKQVIPMAEFFEKLGLDKP